MKKLVLVAMMMLVPFTSFALDAMTDADLDGLTAQAGVTIVLSNVRIQQTAATSAWGDAEAGSTSWIVQTNANASNQLINGTVVIDVEDFSYSYTATLGSNITVSEATAVVIGLNLEIYESEGSNLIIGLEETDTADSPTALTAANADGANILGQQYGTSGRQRISGTIAIMAHD